MKKRIKELDFEFKDKELRFLQLKAESLFCDLVFMNRSISALEEVEENLDKQLRGEKSMWD